MHLQPAENLPKKKRTSDAPLTKADCPRSVRAWRAWLSALASDAEAAQAAALAYRQLDSTGRDAWIDSLAQDALEVGVPLIAVYAPLLAVEFDPARRGRIESALGPSETLATPRHCTRALVGDASAEVRVAVLIAPLYMDFVQVMACGYRSGSHIDWVRHDPIVLTKSSVSSGDRIGGAVVEERPLKAVVDELALTIVAHHRTSQLPEALRAFAHVFSPSAG